MLHQEKKNGHLWGTACPNPLQIHFCVPSVQFRVEGNNGPTWEGSHPPPGSSRAWGQTVLPAPSMNFSSQQRNDLAQAAWVLAHSQGRRWWRENLSGDADRTVSPDPFQGLFLPLLELLVSLVPSLMQRSQQESGIETS